MSVVKYYSNGPCTPSLVRCKIRAQHTSPSPDTVIAPLYDVSFGPLLVPKASTSKAMFCCLSECIKLSILDPTMKVKSKEAREVKQQISKKKKKKKHLN